MDIKTIKQLVPELLKLGQVPIFVGHRGMGKTEVMGQIAKSMGGDLHAWRLGQMSDPGDIIGIAQPTDRGTVKFMPPDHLPTEGSGIIFLDEINRAPKDLLQAMFEFVEKGSFISYTKPEGFGVVAACNPDQAGYTLETAVEFDQAFADRMIFIKFEPTTSDWISYGKAKDFDPSVLAYISEHPQDLDGEIESINLDFIKPSRRSWERLSKIKKALSETFDENTLLEVYSGICGAPLAIKFAKFAKDFETNVKPEQVLNSYKSVKAVIKKSSEDRHDMINATNEELLTKIYGMNKISERQLSNLKEFLLDIPRDMSWNFILKVGSDCPKCLEKKPAFDMFFEDEEFITTMRQHFNLKTA